MFSDVSLDERIPQGYPPRRRRRLGNTILGNMGGLLFSWFIGLGVDAPVRGLTVFSINRDRLLRAEMAHEFFQRMLQLAEWRGFVSDAHFRIDGSMIEVWASRKSLVATDGSGPEGTSERTIHGRSQG